MSKTAAKRHNDIAVFAEMISYLGFDAHIAEDFEDATARRRLPDGSHVSVDYNGCEVRLGRSGFDETVRPVTSAAQAASDVKRVITTCL